MVCACKEHGINKSLEVNGLVPFDQLVAAVFNWNIRHVVPDWQLDLFKEDGHKTSFFLDRSGVNCSLSGLKPQISLNWCWNHLMGS